MGHENSRPLKQYLLRYIGVIVILGLTFFRVQQMVYAQSPDGTWTDFVNISQTPTGSIYPDIAADAAGNVHVVWSEDMGGSPDSHTAWGNTLYYTRWDGEQWLPGIDVQIASEGNVMYPAITVDPRGVLHVIWIGGFHRTAKLLYSQAHVNGAMSAWAWSKPVALAEPLVQAYYTADIVADSTGGIHIFYFQLGADSGAYVINSYDGGNTWTAPALLYRSISPYGDEDGTAPIKIIADRSDRLHATWTYYDRGGNGQAIFYAQSSDLGQTWSQPLEVATTQPGWYEVDWLNVAAVDNKIVLVWEGGEGSYVNERVSDDGGQTWSAPRRILYNLVGENGWTDLVVDSANQLHQVSVKRGESDGQIHGLWYSRWENDHWSDAILLGTRNDEFYARAGNARQDSTTALLRGAFAVGGLRYQKTTLVEGNRLFVVVVNEDDGEIWSSHATLSASHIPLQPYPEATAMSMPTPTPTPSVTPTSTPLPRSFLDDSSRQREPQVAEPIFFGVIPVFLLLAGVFLRVLALKRFGVRGRH